jgi:hypothetical protein
VPGTTASVLARSTATSARSGHRVWGRGSGRERGGGAVREEWRMPPGEGVHEREKESGDWEKECR